MRAWRALCLGLCVAVGWSANALAARAPTLPENAGKAEIEAWIEEHIDPGAEMQGVSFDDAVEYYDPRDLEKRPDGHVVAKFRMEYWRPQREGRTTWRSERQRVEIDCATTRARFLSVDRYPENNLQGRATPQVLEAAWVGPFAEDDVDGQELLQVCSFAKLLDDPQWESAAPPPPTAFEDEDLADWFRARTKPGDDVLLQQAGGLATYYTPADLERLPNGRVRAWVRRELAWPMVLGASGVRSTRMQYEIDCGRRRYRNLDLIVFPGQNLTGPPYADFPNDDVGARSIEAGSAEAPVMRALCALASDPKLPPSDAVRAPPPPPPEGLSDIAAETWVRKHINTAGYAVSSHDDRSVIFYAPASLDLLPNGHVTVSVRREAMVEPEGGLGRSMLVQMQFDCSGRRSRILGMTTFKDANLEGERTEGGESDWRRFDNGSHEALLAPTLCAQRELLAQDVDREAALTPPPVDSDDEEEVIGWVAEHVRPLGYTYVNYSDEGAAFYSVGEGERTRQDYIRVWTRYELFSPTVVGGTVVRSLRRLMEFDCEQGRSRILTVEVYPGANLTGRPTARQAPSAEWSFTSPNTIESSMADAVCSFADEVDSADDEAVSAPRLPQRRDASPL